MSPVKNQAVREPSRTAYRMNCRLNPVPFIAVQITNQMCNSFRPPASAFALRDPAATLPPGLRGLFNALRLGRA